MNNQEIIQTLSNALTYIENHLDDNIQLDDLIKESYMSKTAFYDLFKAMIGHSPGQFIRLRRLSHSGIQLVYTKKKVIDIALAAGYETSEAYSRAFKKMYGISPSKFRERSDFSEIFPKLFLTDVSERSTHMSQTCMTTKQLLSNLLKENYQGYLFNIDIDKFTKINENFTRDGGDLVLETVPERITHLLKNNPAFKGITRIGGDQFVIVVRDIEKESIEKMAQDILMTAKDDIPYGSQQIPYSLSIGISKYSLMDSDDALQRSEDAMIKAKRAGRNGYEIA